MSDDCWSSHFMSAMEGLAHSHVLKHGLLNCEPVDLSCFVVDLRTRHLYFLGAFPKLSPERSQ